MGTNAVSPIDVADGAARVGGRRIADSVVLVSVACTPSGDSTLPSGFRGILDRQRGVLRGEIWRTVPDTQRFPVELTRTTMDSLLEAVLMAVPRESCSREAAK